MSRTIVFSDLDGTLLDHASYDWQAARPALARLGERGVPLVLVSSKTRLEMTYLAGQLGVQHPFVVENGGAVVFPAGYLGTMPEGADAAGDQWVVPLGTPIERLREALADIGRELGLELRGFSSMTLDEVAAATALAPEAAARAQAREWNEPFLVRGGATPDRQRLDDAAKRRGLSVTRGGRFFHLKGPVSKGRAARVLLDLLEAGGGRFDRTIALGDAWNDADLLQAVGEPIIVPRPSGAPDPELVRAVPAARVAPAPGARGWNLAVLDALAQSP